MKIWNRSDVWNVALALVVFVAVGLLAACVQPEPSKPAKVPEVRLVDAECDGQGVSRIRVQVDGPGVVEVSWSNKRACGEPT